MPKKKLLRLVSKLYWVILVELFIKQNTFLILDNGKLQSHL